MENDDYEYPYGDAQTHEALADLDRRLKALEPKPDEPLPAEEPASDFDPLAD